MVIVLDKKHIQVQRSTWNGVLRLDIREMYLEHAEDGTSTLKPTKKGISIPIEFTETLQEAINMVYRETER